jgi:hypothetical protein
MDAHTRYMDAHTRYQTQIVGALPVITHYLEQIDLAATIDGLVPWEGDVPLGTLVAVLIANRLLQPKALFRVGQWARASALTDYYGLTAEQLNDDRLGRALERLAEHAPEIQAALVLKAIEHFDLDVTQVHYDLTTAELYGAYEVDTAGGQPPPTPLPTHGRTMSGRKHVKQVQRGLDVTGDGGVPVRPSTTTPTASRRGPRRSATGTSPSRCLSTWRPRSTGRRSGSTTG